MITGMHAVALTLASTTSAIAIVCRAILAIDPGMYGLTQLAAVATASGVVLWVWAIVLSYAQKVQRHIAELERRDLADEVVAAMHGGQVRSFRQGRPERP